MPQQYKLPDFVMNMLGAPFLVRPHMKAVKSAAKTIVLLLVVSAYQPSPASADLDCMDSEYLVSGSFGVNPTAAYLPPHHGLPGAESGELIIVYIQWLAQANRERQNEFLTIDYVAGTTTNVDVMDGSIGSTVITDLRLAEIDPSSNFSRGQLNVNWCMPVGRTDGLVFAVYAHDGAVVGLQGTPFAIFEGASSTAVLNNAITHQMGSEFNEGGAERTLEDIEAETGVYPGRHLAEQIFQRNMPAMLRDELLNAALLHAPVDGEVVGNMFIVTGDEASAYAPTHVESAYRGGADFLNPSNWISGLDTRMGEWTFVVNGQRRPVFVIEGRADLSTGSHACKDYRATISAGFEYPSSLQSVIELWKSDELVRRAEDGSLEAEVICDGTFTVKGTRSIRGQAVDTESVSLEMALASTEEFRIVGLSTENDQSAEYSDADGDGVLDGPPLDTTCETGDVMQYWLVMDPPLDQKAYTLSHDSFDLTGWSLVYPNEIQYQANCLDAGKTVSPQVIATVMGVDRELTIPINVSQPTTSTELYGVDYNQDGVADLVDEHEDGVFDGGLAVRCGNVPPGQVIDFLVTPAGPGNFEHGALPPDSNFDPETGRFSFYPSCALEGASYDLAVRFVPEGGPPTRWMTLQLVVYPAG